MGPTAKGGGEGRGKEEGRGGKRGSHFFVLVYAPGRSWGVFVSDVPSGCSVAPKIGKIYNQIISNTNSHKTVILICVHMPIQISEFQL